MYSHKTEKERKSYIKRFIFRVKFSILVEIFMKYSNITCKNKR